MFTLLLALRRATLSEGPCPRVGLSGWDGSSLVQVVGHPRVGSSHPPLDSPPSIPLVVVWDVVRLQRKGRGKCTAEAGRAGPDGAGPTQDKGVGGEELRKQEENTGLRPSLGVLRSEAQ